MEAKIYSPPYSKAEIERQKIENEQVSEQMQNTGQKGLGVGVRAATVRF